ncbi:flavin-containing superfamily amine oxidase [Mollisia scopiformis]|uniref:Flavin-containing superfamily amine oxidase n=1 Tax=Mollisia scopiformis TaxID=149040 RepID=A0A194WYU3_MOLSC|nr:flavin-containing superfamily amine oxidase [Mollisia scopiformis]KUJ12864.1 flavin-containing superfamily amine oxidase [Mollisia scopiformis]
MAFFKTMLWLYALPIIGFTRADILSLPSSTITSDYCIIGGGSSGTYAAIRLQQLGKTVTLIEKNSRLGGHVNTYFDPVTGSTFDYGVISFDNISVVTDYFEYLDVPLAPLNFEAGSSVFVDFANDTVVPATALPQGNVTAALLGYLAQLDKYPNISNGYNLPTPVPEDFLITWGDFLQKYELGDMAYTVYTFLQGVGNILAQPTLYIFKYLTKRTVENILGLGFLSTSHHDNQQLYNNALAKLGPSAFLSSNVTQVTRLSDNVEVLVSTPSGPKLIQSSKLLIAIQPKIENLGFLDLDYEEAALFGKFNNSYYWDAVLRNTGIPDNISLVNVDLAAPYTIPAMPALYNIDYSGVTDLQTAYYTSPSYFSDEEVKCQILATTAKLVELLGYPAPNGTTEFVGFNNHAPFELTVSVEDIADGFYDKLNALQGARNTFWTGATWQAHDSSEIWNWTEYTLLPQLLA